ncbi:uncharacterized protein LOC108630467 [Ceratina calcarata]|uniref:Uncharacterized protein LOC108630467 n=1 Tax=Ceratina calcarata TaxID=156304 RepID=A0AAJ7NDM7_9HYME|nr:uncharacterized protein LOC108630467 [Ceratina calcarata]
MVVSAAGIFIPTSLELYVSMKKKDMDAVIECLPHLIATVTSVVKILNLYFYRENFKRMFGMTVAVWHRLNSGELTVLEEITARGSRVAQLYRNTLLIFTVLFVSVPMLFPIMDVIAPLNETRPRQQMLRVNYVAFDADEYFFYVYIQLSWSAVVVVSIIVTVDSLYIVIIHHNSGLFAVCGYKLQNVTKNRDAQLENESRMYGKFRECVLAHKEAIEFYDALNQSSRNSYLLQVGLNMMGISVTAVQTVVNLDKPEEAIRTGIFLGAEQFHLFVISLPGQVLIDHCSQLAEDIYGSTWYKVPVRIQRMLYTMQIRSSRRSALTAGGLYEMNIENFGITFKTCMSYFTMLMSLKELSHSEVAVGFRKRKMHPLEDGESRTVNGASSLDIFDIPHYAELKRFLRFAGQDPRQHAATRIAIMVAIVISTSGVIIPSSLEVYLSLRRNDMDAVIECLPHLIASVISLVKIVNLYLYRENLKNMFDMITAEWHRLGSKEFVVLETVTAEGSLVARLYRNSLLFVLVLFVTVPLLPPLLDVIIPLNETRPRPQTMRVNYVLFDADDYFFYVYLQLSWSATVVVTVIVTVDSLYTLIIYHNSALFAVCGFKVQEATKNEVSVTDDDSEVFERFRECVTVHKRALLFYDILYKSSSNSYLFQVGLNMMGITATAVQTMANLDKPEEALRTGFFLGGEQFHLFVISWPGQILIDYSSQLEDDMYVSSSHSHITYQLRVVQYLIDKSMYESGLYASTFEAPCPLISHPRVVSSLRINDKNYLPRQNAAPADSRGFVSRRLINAR